MEGEKRGSVRCEGEIDPVVKSLAAAAGRRRLPLFFLLPTKPRMRPLISRANCARATGGSAVPSRARDTERYTNLHGVSLALRWRRESSRERRK